MGLVGPAYTPQYEKVMETACVWKKRLKDERLGGGSSVALYRSCDTTEWETSKVTQKRTKHTSELALHVSQYKPYSQHKRKDALRRLASFPAARARPCRRSLASFSNCNEFTTLSTTNASSGLSRLK